MPSASPKQASAKSLMVTFIGSGSFIICTIPDGLEVHWLLSVTEIKYVPAVRFVKEYRSPLI